MLTIDADILPKIPNCIEPGYNSGNGGFLHWHHNREGDHMRRKIVVILVCPSVILLDIPVPFIYAKITDTQFIKLKETSLMYGSTAHMTFVDSAL